MRRNLLFSGFLLSAFVVLTTCSRDSPKKPEQQIPSGIAINPASSTLTALGDTVRLIAAVLDGSDQPIAGAAVEWVSSDEAVATVNEDGLVTAAGNGSARITARSGEVFASIEITVSQTVGSITLTPDEAALDALGATVQLSAAVLDGSDQPIADAAVDWASSDEAVASVSDDGLVAAAGNGSARITAKSGEASASVEITVSQEAGSITLTPDEAALNALGATVQLSAAVLDGRDQDIDGAVVEWASSDDAVATVSAEGLVTAAGNGSARITARSGEVSASAEITVSQAAGSITLTPDEANLTALGATVQLRATVLDGSDQPIAGAAVEWSSNDEAVVRVNEDGLVTAAGNGSVRITARSGAVSAAVEITVSQAAGRITLTPDEANLTALGATVQLSAAVLDGRGQDIDGAALEWASSDDAVATVSAEGLVTAAGNGSARITAKSGDTSASVEVTVSQAAGSITLTPDEANLTALGATVQLDAEVLDGSGQPIADAAVEWASSDEAVAAVSAEGLVTAAGNGSARITAKSGDASASVEITVSQAAGSITLTPDEANLTALGATVQLSATVLDGSDQPIAGAAVEWSSSDEAVASVSAQGVVTAAGNGSARVTARSGEVSASAEITVSQAAGSITLTPDEANLTALGATVQLRATVLDGSDQPIAGAAVEWSSSDEAVATINDDGLVTAAGNGSARITAKSGEVSASAEITVSQAAGSITLTPDQANLTALGATVQLSAAVLDGRDQPIAGAAVEWSSSDDAVVTVNEDGLVTAAGNGSARVSARYGEISASLRTSPWPRLQAASPSHRTRPPSPPWGRRFN